MSADDGDNGYHGEGGVAQQGQPAEHRQIGSDPVRSGQLRSSSGPIRSVPVRSGQIRSDPVRSGLFQLDKYFFAG